MDARAVTTDEPPAGEPAPPLGPWRSLAALETAGLVPPEDPRLAIVAARYPVAVTATMAARLLADPHGPVARQFLPDARELDETPQERADPIGDDAHSPLPGLVHRYPDRVLLKPLHACPVYCRFCFRRAMVGPGGEALDEDGLTRAAAYVAARPAIREVIVTGGDPFLLSPRRVRTIMESFGAPAPILLVRWHTRVPVVDPERVDAGLIAALRAGRAPAWVVLHANHADEFTPAADRALAALAEAGVPLLAQSVLLRGINDTVEALEALFRAFLARRVKPYYLHHPDLAPGTGHWRLSIRQGRALMRALRGRLSGLALPSYVLDVPDGAGKVPLGPDHVEDGPEGLALEALDGRRLTEPS